MLATGSSESVWGARAFACAAICAAILGASPARAFRTAADRSGFEGTERVRWASANVTFVIDADAPAGVSAGAVQRDAQLAAGSWTAVDCSEIQLAVFGVTSTSARPGDGVNTVSWVRSSWRERGFPPDAAATTDVAYETDAASGQWRIVEADIYLNGADFRWATGSSTPPDARNVRAVITHEFGHALGLLHACEPSGADGAPDCGSDPGFAATTMYPLYTGAPQWEIHPDDRDGACFLYPRPADGGCAETCGAGHLCVDGSCEDACLFTSCRDDERCEAGACIPTRTACATDSDCGRGATCSAGFCATPFVAWGDPCMNDAACGGLLCEAGSCQPACSSDVTCPSTSACTTGTAGRSFCKSSRASMGAPCSMPVECVGALCLSGAGAAPICTRRCGGGCPTDFTCSTVEAEDVCVPRSVFASAGCSVSPRRASVGPGLLAILFLAILGRPSRVRRRLGGAR